MRVSKLTACIMLCLLVAFCAPPAGAVVAHPHPIPVPSSGWGVILRNTTGDATALLRRGPRGRSGPSALSATLPPPYGVGSLQMLIGRTDEKTDFGNETIFGGLPLRNIATLKYWIFAGEDVPNISGFPVLSLEVNPMVGGIGFTSLVYVPGSSSPPSRPPLIFPSTWEQYDASGAGGRWYPTNVPLQGLIGCPQVPGCSFAYLKSKLPNAFVSDSIGISAGTGGTFTGAVDGLQINHAVYDFEPFGVRRTTPRPL